MSINNEQKVTTEGDIGLAVVEKVAEDDGGGSRRVGRFRGVTSLYV